MDTVTKLHAGVVMKDFQGVGRKCSPKLQAAVTFLVYLRALAAHFLRSVGHFGLQTPPSLSHKQVHRLTGDLVVLMKRNFVLLCAGSQRVSSEETTAISGEA